MDNVIQEIHSSFDNATDYLIDIANEKRREAQSVKLPETDKTGKSQALLKLGFNNTAQAKEYVKTKEQIDRASSTKNMMEEKSEAIMHEVELYKNLFPFHKFILYPQLINILEDYKLYVGHSSLYTGDIPEKNVKEIESFYDDYIHQIGNAYENRSRFSEYQRDYRVLPAGMPEEKHNKPLCTWETRRQNSHKGGRDKSFYICAPKYEFNISKNVLKIGHELVYDDELRDKVSYRELIKRRREHRRSLKDIIKDPIVLFPVGTDLEQLGFIVVSKWGLEAEDKRLITPKNN